MFPHVLIENAEEHEYIVRLEKSLNFFNTIFGNSFKCVFISSISELSDFRFAGELVHSDDFQNTGYAQLCRQWDAAVLAKIEATYKVKIDTTQTLLKDLFEQCLQGKATYVN